MILFKLLNQGFFSQIDGCLSTGKEANVYYAVGGEVSAGVDNLFSHLDRYSLNTVDFTSFDFQLRPSFGDNQLGMRAVHIFAVYLRY